MSNANAERDRMTDAVIDIVFGDKPNMDNELAINVLVDALRASAVRCATSCEG